MSKQFRMGPNKSLMGGLASYMMILMGLTAVLVIGVVCGEINIRYMGMACGVFAAIAAIPIGLSGLFDRQSIREDGISFRSAWNFFRRRREKPAPKVREWRRKKTDFVSTPFGQEIVEATFEEHRQVAD